MALLYNNNLATKSVAKSRSKKPRKKFSNKIKEFKLKVPKSELISLVDLAEKLKRTYAFEKLQVKSGKIVDNLLGENSSGKKRPEFKETSIFNLYTDKYQRLISLKVIDNMEAIDLTLLVPVIVWVRPDGTYVVTDGQHKVCLTWYVMGIEYEIPCFVLHHPSNRTEVECLEIESKHFVDINFKRKNTDTLDKIRSGLVINKVDALNFEYKLKALNLHIQGIGNVDGYEINAGYNSAIKAFEVCEKSAKKAVKNVVQWSKLKEVAYPSTKLILALTHIYKMINVFSDHDNTLTLSVNLNNFIENDLKMQNLDDLEKKASGQIGVVIVARRIIDLYNRSLMPDSSLRVTEDQLIANNLKDPSVI